jgi:pterin-4a-carbinolamine dehydratase
MSIKTVSKLKAERVQEELAVQGTVSKDAVLERLKAERVQERLKRMPGWGLSQDGKALDRVRQFVHDDDAVDFATLALRLASRERYPARVHVEGKSVFLTLHDHTRQGARGGITEKLLDFAARLG